MTDYAAPDAALPHPTDPVRDSCPHLGAWTVDRLEPDRAVVRCRDCGGRYRVSGDGLFRLRVVEA